MSSINGNWRSLLRPANQNLLIYVLKRQFSDFFKTGIMANIISPSDEEQAILQNTQDDLSQICRLFFSSRFSDPTGENRHGVDSIGFQLIKNPSFREAAGLSFSQAQLFRRRTIDIPAITRVIRDHRNYQVHDNGEIDDKGNAAFLASAILRLLEIVNIPEERIKECENLRVEVLQLLSSVSENNQEETTTSSGESNIDEILTEVSKLRETIKNKNENESNHEEVNYKPSNKSSNIKGTIGKQHLTAEYFTKQFGQHLERLEQKQEVIFPMLEQVIQALRQVEKSEDSLSRSLIDEVRSVVVSQDNLITQIDTKIRLALGSIPEATKDAIANIANNYPPSDVTEDEDWEEDGAADLPERDTQLTPSGISEAEGLGSLITREQGRQRLLSLRNEIRRDFNNGGQLIENWENILQGPIIDAMIQQQVIERKEWDKAEDIVWRYNKHQALMDLQLEKYWVQISEILGIIEWGATGGDELDDEIPF